MPDDTHWSLTERPGYLRLHSLPAPDFWTARNSLTQRAVGPQSSATTVLDASGMRENDVAGLALLNGRMRGSACVAPRAGLSLQQYDQTDDSTVADAVARDSRVWLRVDCDFLTEQARFSYSTDGTTWTPFGRPFTMVFQLKTFQGVRFALFNYNTGGAAGGVADFDFMRIDEPHPRGLMQPIPVGRTIALSAAGRDTPLRSRRTGPIHRRRSRPRPRRARGERAISVGRADVGQHEHASRFAPARRGDAETFQWMETMYGDLMLMSLATHRYLRLEPDGRMSSDSCRARARPERWHGASISFRYR